MPKKIFTAQGSYAPPRNNSFQGFTIRL